MIKISHRVSFYHGNGFYGHFNDFYNREDYENIFEDYHNQYILDYHGEAFYNSQLCEDQLYQGDECRDYFPDFSTCFIVQNKIRNFQVICYLKFLPEGRSKNIDSDFFNIFEQSTKSSVFWAYCDIASIVDHYIDTEYITDGEIIQDYNSWLFNWWERDYNIYIY